MNKSPFSWQQHHTCKNGLILNSLAKTSFCPSCTEVTLVAENAIFATYWFGFDISFPCGNSQLDQNLPFYKCWQYRLLMKMKFKLSLLELKYSMPGSFVPLATFLLLAMRNHYPSWAREEKEHLESGLKCCSFYFQVPVTNCSSLKSSTSISENISCWNN